MTEEEAKAKWCPHVSCDDENEKCIASTCMAWRWTPLKANTPEYIEALKVCEKEHEMKAPAAAAYVRDNPAEFDLPIKPFEGYCGLAGKP